MSLQHLFDAELRHRADAEPFLPEGDGQLIGSGDGAVTGARPAGTSQLDALRASRRARVHHEPDRRDRDRGRRRGSHRGARVRCDDERYRWLSETLGVWEGEFDAESARASYRAYLQTDGNEAG
jgi:hypothetical protein